MADDLTSRAEPTPTVIVSHLDVVYRVMGGQHRGRTEEDGERGGLTRLLRQGRAKAQMHQIHAVKDVSFVARHGESIGIIGRNGSGKSTLLRAVAGLIPPTNGRVWVDGHPSLLGVNAVLMPKLTGERNIYIGGQALGLSTAEIRERFDEIVDFSGIGDAVYLPMSTYSSGMGARLRFAISTAAQPDVLMIDEALATGDAAFRAKSSARIAEIRESAGTVFLVSHSNSTIRQVCQRALWMERGELVMDGPADEVVAAYEATQPRKKSSPADSNVPGVVRHGGQGDRLRASAELTAQVWPTPGIDGAFVVSTHEMAHARVAAPVAARLGWPLIWTKPGSTPPIQLDQLTRLQPSRVVVVGGPEQVNESTMSTIEGKVEARVERIGDDDIARTSAALLTAFPPDDPTTVHVTARPHDARSGAMAAVASARGQALVAVDGISDELGDVLRDLAPSSIVMSGVEEDWPSETVRWLAGVAAATPEWHGATGPMSMTAEAALAADRRDTVIVAGDRSGVEALSACAASDVSGSHVILVRPDRVPEAVGKALTDIAPVEITVVGGTRSISPKAIEELGRYVAP